MTLSSYISTHRRPINIYSVPSMNNFIGLRCKKMLKQNCPICSITEKSSFYATHLCMLWKNMGLPSVHPSVTEHSNNNNHHYHHDNLYDHHCESSSGSFHECRMVPSGRRPNTKPDDLGCESACTRLQETTSTIAIYYYYSARKLILILPSHRG